MIDLHNHTINSDGDFTTKEVLLEAFKNGLSILSITDHNNISSYDEIRTLNVKDYYNGKIITGVELEFQMNGRLFDMLGYGFDVDKIRESEIIKKGLIHSTVEGETKILNKLKEICDRYNIKYSNNLHIENANNMANDVLLDDIISYKENKSILDEFGIFDRSTFYRRHFCEPKSPFYIDQTEGKYDVEYVIKVIRDAGGKTFFAHPFAYKLSNIKEIIDDLVSKNLLDGIECEHRKHTNEQIEWLINYCNNHNLLKSGGSDRHTIHHLIGHCCNNSKEIKEELVKDWINDINAFY